MNEQPRSKQLGTLSLRAADSGVAIHKSFHAALWIASVAPLPRNDEHPKRRGINPKEI